MANRTSWINKPPLGAKINFSHPLTNGLVACWLMNEGGGFTTVNDLAAPSRPLTMHFSAGSNGQWGVGRSGPCLQWLSGTAYLVGSSSTNYGFTNQTFTLAVWFRTTNASYQILMSCGNTSTSFGGYLFATTPKLELELYASAGDSADRVSSSSVNDGKWHLGVVVVKTDTATTAGNDIQIYVDGVLNQSALTKVNPYVAPAADNILLGSRIPTAPTTSYVGKMDCFFIWNRGLSVQEIQQLYINTYPMFQSPKRRMVAHAAASTGSLFLPVSNLNGLGTGGKFYTNPLG